MDAHIGTNLTPSSCKESAAVCIFYRDTVCLARRIKTCPIRNKIVDFPEHWAPFGGLIDSNENPMMAACRELKEEAHIEIEASDLTYMQSITNEDGSLYILYAYHTDNLLFPVLNFENTEYGYFFIESLNSSPSPICPKLKEAIMFYYSRRWRLDK